MEKYERLLFSVLGYKGEEASKGPVHGWGNVLKVVIIWVCLDVHGKELKEESGKFRTWGNRWRADSQRWVVMRAKKQAVSLFKTEKYFSVALIWKVRIKDKKSCRQVDWEGLDWEQGAVGISSHWHLFLASVILITWKEKVKVNG